MNRMNCFKNLVEQYLRSCIHMHRHKKIILTVELEVEHSDD
jgi:hypothetical protein